MKKKENEIREFKKLNSIKKPTNLLFNIVFVILSLVCIIPFIFIFIISISSEGSIARNGYRFFPEELSLSAYEFLWNEKDVIFNAFGISVIVTVIGTILGVILTTSLGYVLSRSNYKLKGFFTWVVFIPMVFNGGMVASYVVNANILGLSDSIWALILPLAVNSFNVVICKTFLRQLSRMPLLNQQKSKEPASLIFSLESLFQFQNRFLRRLVYFWHSGIGTIGFNLHYI